MLIYYEELDLEVSRQERRVKVMPLTLRDHYTSSIIEFSTINKSISAYIQTTVFVIRLAIYNVIQKTYRIGCRTSIRMVHMILEHPMQFIECLSI